MQFSSPSPIVHNSSAYLTNEMTVFSFVHSPSDIDNNKQDAQQTGTSPPPPYTGTVPYQNTASDRGLLYAAADPSSSSVGHASINTSNTTINSIPAGNNPNTDPSGQKMPFSPSEIFASKRSYRGSAQDSSESKAGHNVSGVGTRGRVDVATINVGMNRGFNRYQVPSAGSYLDSSGLHGSMDNVMMSGESNIPHKPNGRAVLGGYTNEGFVSLTSPVSLSNGVSSAPHGSRGKPKVPPKVPPKPSSASAISSVTSEYANTKVRSG